MNSAPTRLAPSTPPPAARAATRFDVMVFVNGEWVKWEPRMYAYSEAVAHDLIDAVRGLEAPGTRWGLLVSEPGGERHVREYLR